MTGQTLERALSEPAIPALPTVVSAAIDRPDGAGGREGLAELLALDPAITLAVLARANAERGSDARVGRLSRAIELLDGEALRTIALSVPLLAPGEGDVEGIDFDFASFWSRAIRASVAARHLTQVTSAHEPEEAAIAALLADVGMVALHRAFGDRYLQVLDIAGCDHRNLAEVEQRTLRIDHALIGAELAARARLPEAIVAAIRHHHRHPSAGTEERRLAAVLELASIAALAVDEAGLHAEDATVRFRRSAHAWLGLPPHEGLVLLEEIRAESSHRLSMAGVATLHEVEALARGVAEARRAAGIAGPNAAPSGCTRDPLTGLADRESFMERLDAALGLERPRGGSVAILVAAVDDLRELNLRLGVRGGDALLRSVGLRLVTAVPPGAEVFRLMGSQFAILGPGLSPLEARRLADDLRRAVTSEPLEVTGERAVRVTLSIGAAIDRFAPEHPAAGVAPIRETLVRGALAALASAEASGRNRTTVFRDGREAA